MAGLAKKGSGQISVTRTDGANPGGIMSPPGPGDAAGPGPTDKHSGTISVTRDVQAPPTHGPAK